MGPLSKTIALVLVGCLAGRAQISGNGGNDRSNANLQETQLSPSTVSPATFGKLGTFPVDGQVYAQPLYASGLAMGSAGTRNVLFVATLHNSVYAFDAESAASPITLWHANLGTPVPASQLFGQFGDLNPEVGILSTPVVDLQRGLLYVVSDNLKGGSAAFNLHALDLATGREQLGGPVTIGGAVSGSGSASVGGSIAFNAQQHLQRPGLALANGVIYVSFGSHGDQSPYHGWLISFDAGDLHLAGIYMSTPNGDGGSIWQSGRAPAIDDKGNIYVLTGNGDYDGVDNFGQSILKLSGAAPVRTGSFTSQDWQSLSDGDADLAAGPALIAGTHRLVAADKAGNLYLLDGDAMGQPGPASPDAFQVIPVGAGPIFNLAVWSRPGAANIYLQALGEPLKCLQLKGAVLNTTPVSIAATPVIYPRIGMMISANGTLEGTGIVWETTGNYNDVLSPAILHAYDAGSLDNELWSSDMNPARDSLGPMVKFVSPVVANGRVYVPSYANRIVVYGLLQPLGDLTDPPVVTTVSDAAGYSTDAVSPGEIVSIFGSNLGPPAPAGMEITAAGRAATSIGDTQVLFDGVPAAMVWAGPAQVNAIVPFGVDPHMTQVQVQYGDRVSDPVPVPVAPATPGLFSSNGSGTGQVLALNQDGSLNNTSSPAPAGSVIVVYATGAGQLSPPPDDGAVFGADNLPAPVLAVTAEIGGKMARVLYAAGAPGMVAGVLQVNIEIPADAPPGPASIVVRAGDAASQPGLTLAIR